MIGLLQRVSRARVSSGGEVIAQIGRGLLILVGVERADTPREAARLAERVLGYRVFPDDTGRMNRSVREAGGAVLLVPQFTLAADTRTGRRAGFSSAARPEPGRRLFETLHSEVSARHADTCAGRFGADMQVELVNDGPVTFWLRAAPP